MSHRKAALAVYLIAFWVVFLAAALVGSVFRAIRAYRFSPLSRRGGPLRVLFVDGQPETEAGHHYRVTKWMGVLEGDGFICERASFLRSDDPMFNAGDEARASPAWTHTRLLLRRLGTCFRAASFDVVIVRRELLLFNDNGGAFLDRLLLSITRRVILDFDDNLSEMKNEARRVSGLGALFLDRPGKFREMLALYPFFTPAHASMIPVIETFQPGFDRRNALVLPMCVDYGGSGRTAREYRASDEPITFGWLGGGAKIHFLDILLPALVRLSESIPLRLVVVSSADYQRDVPFPIRNERWSLATEIPLMRSFDVALSPLPPESARRNIGTFKLVQYMGLGIVSIASAISFTQELIRHGDNGFLVENPADWERVLREVVERRGEFSAIGRRAELTIAERHSYAAFRPAYTAFLRHVASS